MVIETRAAVALRGRPSGGVAAAAEDAEAANPFGWLVDAFTNLTGESSEEPASKVPPLALQEPTSRKLVRVPTSKKLGGTLAAIKLKASMARAEKMSAERNIRKARLARGEEAKRAVEERMGRELSPDASPERNSPSPERQSPERQSPERQLPDRSPKKLSLKTAALMASVSSLPSAGVMPPPQQTATAKEAASTLDRSPSGRRLSSGAPSKSRHVESEFVQKARAEYSRPAHVEKPPSLLYVSCGFQPAVVEPPTCQS